MTDARKVHPVAPLDAEPDGIGLTPRRWWLHSPNRPGDLIGSYTDAEFAAAFMPAELFDAVLAAARAVASLVPDWKGSLQHEALADAVRAYDAHRQTT